MAIAYVRRIRSYCEGLEPFPERGVARYGSSRASKRTKAGLILPSIRGLGRLSGTGRVKTPIETARPGQKLIFL